jgi:hypothetical protein
MNQELACPMITKRKIGNSFILSLSPIKEKSEFQEIFKKNPQTFLKDQKIFIVSVFGKDF